MLVGVASPYLGAVFGVRRVLLLGIILFFMASLLAPLTDNLPAFVALLGLAGFSGFAALGFAGLTDFRRAS